MPRRDREQKHGFKIAIQKVSALLNSPLDQIGHKLCDFLNDANRASNARELDDTAMTRLTTQVAEIVDRLPQSFGERFHFDSALIVGIGADWIKNFPLSSMIIPRHQNEWAHERIPMPSEDLNTAHVVDVIHMPGTDDLTEVDLLTYPWMIHEMGHHLLFRFSPRFEPAFNSELGRIVSNLRLISIADRGSARTKSQRTLEKLESLWSPSHGQSNWAHELAIDFISVWTLGPAYIACFKDAVENQNRNPYEITGSHPPLIVRADALIAAAKRLGHQNFSGSLQTLTEEWRRPPWTERRDSRFHSLARPELINACTNVALSFCESLNLTKCTPEKLENIPQSLAEYKTDEIGLDLLLFAWFIFEMKGKKEYTEWESKTLKNLAKSIMQ